MGLFISRLFDSLSGLQSKRIILIGLDGAGKTTILYKLNLDQTVHTIPTVGFNVDRVHYKNVEFTCWDIGGQKKIRALWYHYFQNTDAIIFVIDSNDRERLSEAREELCAVLSHDLLKDAPFLIYSNKQDLPNSMPVDQVIRELELRSDNICRRHAWHVQGTTATTGDGLYEGLDWIVQALKKK